MMQGVPTQWQYTDNTQRVVSRNYPDGSTESCLTSLADVQAWIAQGNTPLAPS